MYYNVFIIFFYRKTSIVGISERGGKTLNPPRKFQSGQVTPYPATVTPMVK